MNEKQQLIADKIFHFMKRSQSGKTPADLYDITKELSNGIHLNSVTDAIIYDDRLDFEAKNSFIVILTGAGDNHPGMIERPDPRGSVAHIAELVRDDIETMAAQGEFLLDRQLKADKQYKSFNDRYKETLTLCLSLKAAMNKITEMPPPHQKGGETTQ